MKELFKKIIKLVVNILTIIVFLLLILVIIAKFSMIINGKNYLDIFGYSVFNVASDSMSPAMEVNDIIIVKETDKYEVGDIITYSENSDYVTHRIVSMNDTSLVTRGDANNTSDDAITYDVIIGKVVKILPGLGIWQYILTTPKVYIAIFVTLIIFDLAFSYNGNKKEKNTEEIVVKEIPNKNTEDLEKTVALAKKTLEQEGDDKFNYTIRLDLNKLQEEIDNKLKMEEKDEK